MYFQTLSPHFGPDIVSYPHDVFQSPSRGLLLTITVASDSMAYFLLVFVRKQSRKADVEMSENNQSMIRFITTKCQILSRLTLITWNLSPSSGHFLAVVGIHSRVVLALVIASCLALSVQVGGTLLLKSSLMWCLPKCSGRALDKLASLCVRAIWAVN